MNFSRDMRLLAILVLGIGVGAALGWLIGGRVMAGVALAALVEIIFLLAREDQLTETKLLFSRGSRRFQRHLSVARSRRLATALHDLREAASQLPDAVVLLDEQRQVRWFNPAAETLLGLHLPHDRGVLLQQRLAPSAFADWLGGSALEALNNVTAPGQADSQLSVSLLPFGPHQHLLLARDISQLNRLEQMRRDFVANVSHELRTPLTVIHGYLELLNPEDVPQLAPVLDEMRLQSKRMGQIVEDLLTLSRLETQHRADDERVPMSALLSTIRKEAEAISQGRHQITLEMGTDADLLGSPKDLHSALSNLASNAVRYTPAGGSITIRWKLTPSGAAYSVRDTGFGISAPHLARLTERFYRVSSSRSRDSGGTGLGLSIVKHVLQLHQAHLQIESQPGAGSTFTCYFDAARVLLPVAGSDSATL